MWEDLDTQENQKGASSPCAWPGRGVGYSPTAQTEGLSLPTVEEGPVFAICMAGAHDQATLAKWIQGLQETNPALAQIPVIFRLTASTGELQASSSGLEEPCPPPPQEEEEEEDKTQRQQQGRS